MSSLVQLYEKEALRFVEVVDWNVMDDNLESIVSEEAAVNHCIYTNMMKFKYTVVTSAEGWPNFGPHKHYKQLVRDKMFQKKIVTFGGFRIKHYISGGSSRVRDSRDFIIKSSRVLASAANFFVALSSTPYFRVLNKEEVSILPKEEFESLHFKTTLGEALAKMVARRMTQIQK